MPYYITTNGGTEPGGPVQYTSTYTGAPDGGLTYTSGTFPTYTGGTFPTYTGGAFPTYTGGPGYTSGTGGYTSGAYYAG